MRFFHGADVGKQLSDNPEGFQAPLLDDFLFWKLIRVLLKLQIILVNNFGGTALGPCMMPNRSSLTNSISFIRRISVAETIPFSAQ